MSAIIVPGRELEEGPTSTPAGTGTSTGTNTGDQTITLTGDVTGSGTGSFAATIAAAAVSLAKMANVATGSIFYRKTAGSGAPEVQTLATLKTDLGLTGTNGGDQTITLSGDVTSPGSGSVLAATVKKINGITMSALGTGILKNTTGTGEPSIAVAADFPTLNQNTTGSAAKLTTARAINGVNFDGTAPITVNAVDATARVAKAGDSMTGQLEIVTNAATLLLRQTSNISYAGMRIYNDINSSGRALEIDYFGSAYSAGEAAWIGTTGAFPLILGTNNADRLKISSAGLVRLLAYGAGTLVTDASGNVTASSDARMKTNVADWGRGLDAVLALHPVSFNWTEASDLNTEQLNVGVIAQEVLGAIPEAVSADAQGMYTLSDRPILMALVNAVKELSARVRELEGNHHVV